MLITTKDESLVSNKSNLKIENIKINYFNIQESYSSIKNIDENNFNKEITEKILAVLCTNNEKVYRILKRLYKDADHPDIAQSLKSLAVSYRNHGDVNTANDIDFKAYEIRKKLYKDADHSDIAQSYLT
ncbi:unnamed protein product [Brachionus calyciflorus]|uniref:Uncharacterized protein n=1 Tax=Brachionus calyciflorus TaxID=104777 RepID=A0A814J9E5_9BILA|nr:unnamed protein product [Brachionus calyciflorus]